jgi:hypothetical protein
MPTMVAEIIHGETPDQRSELHRIVSAELMPALHEQACGTTRD